MITWPRRTRRRRLVPDPTLDPFRHGLAELLSDGVVAGHVSTVIAPFWGTARLFGLQEGAWLQVTWVDGIRENEQEDYPPLWLWITDLREGFLEWDSGDRHGRYTVSWLPSDERDRLWERYGMGPLSTESTTDPSP